MGVDAAVSEYNHIEFRSLPLACKRSLPEPQRLIPLTAPLPPSPVSRTALISGGCSGIGLALAQRLHAEGWKVAVCDKDTQGQEMAQWLVFSCDIRKGADIDRLFQQVQAALGPPEVLICNAGQGIHEKLAEGDPEKWQAVLDTNLMGALRLVRAFVPAMLHKGSGDVVFVSSVSAQAAYPYGGVYAASKAALEMVAETLRLEVQPAVRVSTIALGVTDTAFFRNAISGTHTPADIGWGAIAPGEVADTVWHLLTRPPGIAVNHLTLRPVAQPL